MAKKTKSRYWGFIMYPDSMPDDWRQLLVDTGLPIAISPLHDKDTNPDGLQKKPHYHVLLCFDGPTTENVVQGIADSVHASNVIRVMSVRGMWRYHCHLDDPDKYLYDDHDRIHLGGFNCDDYINLTNSEVILMYKSINHFIIQHQIFNYFDLVNSLEREDVSAFSFVVSHTLYFKTYVSERKALVKEQRSK